MEGDCSPSAGQKRVMEIIERRVTRTHKDSRLIEGVELTRQKGVTPSRRGYSNSRLGVKPIKSKFDKVRSGRHGRFMHLLFLFYDRACYVNHLDRLLCTDHWPSVGNGQ